MIVKINFSNGDTETIFDVFSIEKSDFDLRIKKSKHYVYTVYNYETDKIKSVEILKVK